MLKYNEIRVSTFKIQKFNNRNAFQKIQTKYFRNVNIFECGIQIRIYNENNISLTHW